MCAIACTLRDSTVGCSAQSRTDGHCQENVSNRLASARKWVLCTQSQPVRHDAPGERIAVRVKPAALQRDQHVALTDAVRSEDRVFVDIADDEPR